MCMWAAKIQHWSSGGSVCRASPPPPGLAPGSQPIDPSPPHPSGSLLAGSYAPASQPLLARRPAARCSQRHVPATDLQEARPHATTTRPW